MTRPTLEQRFWAKVDMTAGPDACWPWTTYCTPDGYGRFGSVPAHRTAYELSTGEQLGALETDHRCHNRACCNPAHLRPATQKQNGENLRGANRNSRSGVRGVHWSKFHQRWRAAVNQHGGGTVHVGYFDTIEEAAEAVRAKRLELFTHNDIDRRDLTPDEEARLKGLLAEVNTARDRRRSPRQSGVRGVVWNKGCQRWQAQIRHRGKDFYLGVFDTVEEAAEVVRAKRLELFTHNDLDRQESA